MTFEKWWNIKQNEFTYKLDSHLKRWAEAGWDSAVEACCTAVRDGCRVCGGTGYGSSGRDTVECEYCSKPIDVIRRRMGVKDE